MFFSQQFRPPPFFCGCVYPFGNMFRDTLRKPQGIRCADECHVCKTPLFNEPPPRKRAVGWRHCRVQDARISACSRNRFHAPLPTTTPLFCMTRYKNSPPSFRRNAQKFANKHFTNFIFTGGNAFNRVRFPVLFQ